MRAARSISALIAMLAGLFACGVHFTLLYAMRHWPACGRSRRTGVQYSTRFRRDHRGCSRWACVYLVRRVRISFPYSAQRDIESGNFLNFVTGALVFLAVVAILWAMLPTLMITDCRT